MGEYMYICITKEFIAALTKVNHHLMWRHYGKDSQGPRICILWVEIGFAINDGERERYPPFRNGLIGELLGQRFQGKVLRRPE